MEFQIEIEPATGWGMVRIVGEIALDDFPRVFTTLWQHPGWTVSVFRSEDAARRWLQERPAAS